MITIKWHRCRARLLLLLMVFTALYSLLLLSVFMDSGLGLSASSSPTPPCMWLHTGMGIKDEQRNWDFLFSFFFFFPYPVSISCLLLAHLLTGRKRSLLRLCGVGLKNEKSHSVSWQPQRPSGGTELELRQRWTCQQERENEWELRQMTRKQARDNAARD